MAKKETFTERSQRLLKRLIERYINEGLPVGSRTLAEEELALSPATIRHVLSDLEAMGLVESPHTSAGRIPTVNGYRLFVDSLLTMSPPSTDEIKSLEQQIFACVGQLETEILESTSQTLSGLTQLASVVTLPKRQLVSFRQIEFLPLSDKRILVILVVNEKEVQNRIIQVQTDYSPSQLQQAANYLNARFQGQTLSQLRELILREMQQDRQNLNEMMLMAIELADQVAISEQQQDYLMAGQTNLMQFVDFADMERLKALFEAFQAKQGVLHLLEQCFCAEGIQIFIGKESGYQPLSHCSVVTSTYAIDGKVVGVLGVIGPTRMNYQRVIPMVDLTAKLLSTAITPT